MKKWVKKSEKRIYLDWASAAPVSRAAARAYARASKSAWANPGAPHADGARASTVLENARTSIARLAGVQAHQVIFTSGATEANNLAIQGVVHAFAGAATPHVLYMAGSHASVRETIEALATEGKIVATALTLTDGAIDQAALRAALTPDTALVCVDAVCGETGTMYAVREVARTLAAAGSSAKLFVDASQLPLAGPFELVRLGAHLLTLDAQKVGGVRGVGVLIHTHGVTPRAVMHGGGQEHGVRPGTPPVASIAAFAAALTEAAQVRDTFQDRALRARAAFIRTLQESIPDAVINQGAEGVAHILNVSFPGRDTDYAAALMDVAGISISTRSSCETDSEDGSKPVLALTDDAQRAASTLRISWGPSTTPRALTKAAKELVRTIRFQDEHRV